MITVVTKPSNRKEYTNVYFGNDRNIIEIISQNAIDLDVIDFNSIEEVLLSVSRSKLSVNRTVSGILWEKFLTNVFVVHRIDDL